MANMDIDQLFKNLNKSRVATSNKLHEDELYRIRSDLTNRHRKGANKHLSHSSSSSAFPTSSSSAPASRTVKGLRVKIARSRQSHSSLSAVSGALPSSSLPLRPSSPPLVRPSSPPRASSSPPPTIASVSGLVRSLHQQANPGAPSSQPVPWNSSVLLPPPSSSLSSRPRPSSSAAAASSSSSSSSRPLVRPFLQTTSSPFPRPTSITEEHPPCPTDPLGISLHLLKWTLLREKTLHQLQDVCAATKYCPELDVVKSTFDGIVSLLRDVTMEVLTTVAKWQEVTREPADEWGRRPEGDERRTFEWGGVNYVRKIARDTDFLNNVKGLDTYLGITLRHNPIMYYWHPDGRPAHLPGVPKSRRVDKPLCLSYVDERLVQSCGDFLLNELRLADDPYDSDFEGHENDGEEQEPYFKERKNYNEAKSAKSIYVPSAAGPRSLGVVLGFGASSSSTSPTSLGRPIAPRQKMPGGGLAASMSDVKRLSTDALRSVEALRKDQERREHEEARDGPLYPCFLLWKKLLWKMQGVKRMEARVKRRALRDHFFVWASFAYKQIHAQRIAARALQRKKDLLLGNMPQNVQRESLTQHFKAWKHVRELKRKVGAFLKKYGVKWCGICLGAWMHYTRVEKGVKTIRRNICTELMQDCLWKWRRAVVLRSHVLDERLKKRHKMTMACRKWVYNCVRKWKKFVYSRKLLKKMNKTVTRVQKFHAFAHWIDVITSHGIGQRLLDLKYSAISNGKALLSLTKTIFKVTSSALKQENLKKLTAAIPRLTAGLSKPENKASKKSVLVSKNNDGAARKAQNVKSAVVITKSAPNDELQNVSDGKGGAGHGSEEEDVHRQDESRPNVASTSSFSTPIQPHPQETASVVVPKAQVDVKTASSSAALPARVSTTITVETTATRIEQASEVKDLGGAIDAKNNQVKDAHDDGDHGDDDDGDDDIPYGTFKIKQSPRIRKDSLTGIVSPDIGRYEIGSAVALAPAPPSPKLVVETAVKPVVVAKSPVSGILKKGGRFAASPTNGASPIIYSPAIASATLTVEAAPNVQKPQPSVILKKRINLVARDEAARKLNKNFSRFLKRRVIAKAFHRQLNAAHRIERWWLKIKADLWKNSTLSRYSYRHFQAASVVQRWFMRTMIRRLESKEKGRQEKEDKNLLESKATALQSSFRRHLVLSKVVKSNNSAAAIQREWRQHKLMKKQEETDKFGNNSILYAAKSANAELLFRLIKKGWDLKATNGDGQNVLHAACSSEHSGSTYCVEIVLNTDDPDTLNDLLIARDKNGQTPLHVSATRGNKEAILLLLQKGAIITEQDQDYRTALHLAVMNDRRAACQCLIDAGLSPDEPDINGMTALHEAAIRGLLRIGQMLFTGSATVDVIDHSGTSPLHYAVTNDKPAFVAMLLSNGANPNLLDGLGRSPLHLAVDCNSTSMTENLCKAYGNVHARDADGNSPLHWAAQSDAGACAEILLQYQADPSGVNNYNATALQVALGAGYEKCAEIVRTGGSVKETIGPLDFITGAGGEKVKKSKVGFGDPNDVAAPQNYFAGGKFQHTGERKGDAGDGSNRSLSSDEGIAYFGGIDVFDTEEETSNLESPKVKDSSSKSAAGPLKSPVPGLRFKGLEGQAVGKKK